MGSNRGRAVVVALAALVMVAVAACSVSDSYSASKVEKDLRKTQVGKVGGLKLGSAKCPDSEKLKKGVTFTCTLDIADVPVPYEVKVTSVSGSTAHLHFQPSKAILKRSVLESVVSQNLNDASKGATVTCGSGTAAVILANPGQVISCKLALGSQTGSVKIQVTDLAGHLKVVQ